MVNLAIECRDSSLSEESIYFVRREQSERKSKKELAIKLFKYYLKGITHT
jgi:hypothetical protein